MGELRQELRLLVVNEVLVAGRKVDLETRKSGGSTNLTERIAVSLDPLHDNNLTHSLALALRGGGPKSSNGGHFES